MNFNVNASFFGSYSIKSSKVIISPCRWAGIQFNDSTRSLPDGHFIYIQKKSTRSKKNTACNILYRYLSGISIHVLVFYDCVSYYYYFEKALSIEAVK